MSKLRTDFSKILKPKKLCNCCNMVATTKVISQVSWFRGDDEVYLLCEYHKLLANGGEWIVLRNEVAAEKSRRQQSNQPKAKP